MSTSRAVRGASATTERHGIGRALVPPVTDAFGYAASAILVLTISAQIRQQWLKQSTEGVSPLLFVGQIAASAGFVVHSAVIGSRLFVVTNVLVGMAAIVGMVMYLVLRSRGDASESNGDARATTGAACTPSDPRNRVVDPACARALSRGFSPPASAVVPSAADRAVRPDQPVPRRR
jgi:MtN3 and saliva related transmembrane protein